MSNLLDGGIGGLLTVLYRPKKLKSSGWNFRMTKESDRCVGSA
jgi:hypothetical protein